MNGSKEGGLLGFEKFPFAHSSLSLLLERPAGRDACTSVSVFVPSEDATIEVGAELKRKVRSIGSYSYDAARDEHTVIGLAPGEWVDAHPEFTKFLKWQKGRRAGKSRIEPAHFVKEHITPSLQPEAGEEAAIEIVEQTIGANSVLTNCGSTVYSPGSADEIGEGERDQHVRGQPPNSKPGMTDMPICSSPQRQRSTGSRSPEQGPAAQTQFLSAEPHPQPGVPTVSVPSSLPPCSNRNKMKKRLRTDTTIPNTLNLTEHCAKVREQNSECQHGKEYGIEGQEAVMQALLE